MAGLLEDIIIPPDTPQSRILNQAVLKLREQEAHMRKKMRDLGDRRRALLARDTTNTIHTRNHIFESLKIAHCYLYASTSPDLNAAIFNLGSALLGDAAFSHSAANERPMGPVRDLFMALAKLGLERLVRYLEMLLRVGVKTVGIAVDEIMACVETARVVLESA